VNAFVAIALAWITQHPLEEGSPPDPERWAAMIEAESTVMEYRSAIGQTCFDLDLYRVRGLAHRPTRPVCDFGLTASEAILEGVRSALRIAETAPLAVFWLDAERERERLRFEEAAVPAAREEFDGAR
jgi:hypothetical protein